MSELLTLNISQILEGLNKKQFSAVEVTRAYLDKIEKTRVLNMYLEVSSDKAIEMAKKADENYKNNTARLLEGIPVGVKDMFCTEGIKTTASSKILENFVPTYESTVSNKLWQEGAINLGKLSCDEFAMGSSNETAALGNVINPWKAKEQRSPGGSSGGSAAAVKADLCHAALGTDTGGSIRQPAAFCNIVGLKPTYGLVSRHGLIAFASSFDQIGPITKCLKDALSITSVISGRDDFDSTCIGDKIKEIDQEKKIKKLTFGVVKQAIDFPEIDSSIKQQFLNFIDKIKTQGHKINYIDLPLLEHLTPAYYIMTTAEASSNLSRYDGIKYGYQHSANDLDELIIKTRTHGFGKEVKRRIMLGTFVLSSGYYEAYYQKAQKVRQLIKKETENILEKHDYILLPTTPNKPFKIGKKISVTKRYYEDVFTVQANLSGHPALSFPLAGDQKFNASAQLIGKYFSETNMFHVANKLLNN